MRNLSAQNVIITKNQEQNKITISKHFVLFLNEPTLAVIFFISTFPDLVELDFVDTVSQYTLRFAKNSGESSSCNPLDFGLLFIVPSPSLYVIILHFAL